MVIHMNRLKTLILVLAIVMLINTSNVYAESEKRTYANGNITVTIDDGMIAFERSDRQAYKESSDEEWYQIVFTTFDENSNIKVVVFQNHNFYWHLAPIYTGNLDAYKGLTEEELRSLNLSDFTDEEIKANMGDRLAVTQYGSFEQTLNDVYTLSNGLKYSVVGGTVTRDGISTQVMQYTTIVNGYYYAFTLLPFNEGFSTEDLEEFHSTLSKVRFKPASEVNPVVEKDDEIEMAQSEDTVLEDRSNAAITALVTVIPAAIVLFLLRWLISRKEKSATKGENEQQTALEKEVIEMPRKQEAVKQTVNEVADVKIREETTTNKATSDSPKVWLKQGLLSRNNDPSTELRKYKQMLDDGLITQDDYDKLKAKVLNL